MSTSIDFGRTKTVTQAELPAAILNFVSAPGDNLP